MEPDGEEAEESGVEIGHGGSKAEAALILTILSLQVNHQLYTPTVEKIHGSTVKSWPVPSDEAPNLGENQRVNWG